MVSTGNIQLFDVREPSELEAGFIPGATNIPYQKQITAMATKVGGPSQVKQATPEVQKICDEVKHEAEKKAGKKFDVFVAKSFTTQVHVGRDQFVHLRIHKSLPHSGEKLQLHGIQTSKTQQDRIEYF
ncbi:cystatin-B-like protein [Labeo rohita]|uniref:Cystatin-B n=1 Tax=Labeo rohita TaxID=84645 RepID=A0A498LYU0_LABRO|nr:cystatin-B-like protein [Labeo rohita]